MPSNRTGLLIIRAWVEDGSSNPLRARIRMTTDLGAGFETEFVLTDTGDVSRAVHRWLLDVLSAGEAS